MGDSIVFDKAFNFAIEIINTYKHLNDVKKEFVLSKQLLRSATSIGANIKEGLIGQSKKDFVAKLYIALKESSETEYWLQLLIQTEYLDKNIGQALLSEVVSIRKILNSIILTSKNGPKKVGKLSTQY